MSLTSKKLTGLGYGNLIASDNFQKNQIHTSLENMGVILPEDYCQFLLSFPNTGIFDSDILCSGISSAPCAPDSLYPITLLYSSCSNKEKDLFEIRRSQNEIPLNFLIIGNDDAGNYFCLDLRKDTLGNIYFCFSEEEIDKGFYIIANDFTSFILSLRSE